MNKMEIGKYYAKIFNQILVSLGITLIKYQNGTYSADFDECQLLDGKSFKTLTEFAEFTYIEKAIEDSFISELKNIIGPLPTWEDYLKHEQEFKEFGEHEYTVDFELDVVRMFTIYKDNPYILRYCKYKTSQEYESNRDKRSRFKAAQSILIDNGIDEDDADAIAEALFDIFRDDNIYFIEDWEQ